MHVLCVKKYGAPVRASLSAAQLATLELTDQIIRDERSVAFFLYCTIPFPLPSNTGKGGCEDHCTKIMPHFLLYHVNIVLVKSISSAEFCMNKKLNVLDI